MSAPALDVITMGRASVDLYAQQFGTTLEEADTFKKAVGGCPSNIALGAARLGLRTGIVTGVGAEQFGNFIKTAFARGGVSTQGVKTDPERLTALAILSIRDKEHFPLIFFRENCADMGLTESDVDPDFIASAAALLVTGTHFSKPGVEAAQRKAIAAAKAAGRQVIFDIDFRPNLWGLAGHAEGESRFVGSKTVTERLASILPDCDVVVGTDEEIRIAGGSDDTLTALRNIREKTKGLIVYKRGAQGSSAFPDAIPDDLTSGIHGEAFAIEVLNVLGAGDAFMAGFLRGYLKGLPLADALTLGNASGAMVVSRLMCSSEVPTYEELTGFIADKAHTRQLAGNAHLNHLHWVAQRPAQPQTLCAFAIDHRTQLVDMAGDKVDRIPRFKALAVEAARRVASRNEGFGMLMDERFGADLFAEIDEAGLWLARPIELPGSRPLAFETGGDLGSRLVHWPKSHVVKCLAFMHPDDPEALMEQQIARLEIAHDACRRVERVFLLEIVAGKHGPLQDDTMATILDRLYGRGIAPDWWKLEPQPSQQAWESIAGVIEQNDPHCAGVVMLGLDMPANRLIEEMALAGRQPICKGFAIGRTLFAGAAKSWFAGEIDDEAATAAMALEFGHFAKAWMKARMIALAS